VIAGPAARGLDRANWTYEGLAAHLGREHGVRVRKSAMHAFCRRHGIRPYRPTYRFLRGDAAKQERAGAELAVLKRGRPKASSSC
jgi:transposase